MDTQQPTLVCRTTPGARLRDPRDGSIATVLFYNSREDVVALSDGRCLAWRDWDRLEVVR